MAEANNPNSTDESAFEQIDLLVSALVDDILTEEQAAELETLLSEDATTRTRYIQGIQLHADLLDHFRPQADTIPGDKSPVLGFLADVNSQTPDGQVPLPPTSSTDAAE
ncbi:MAG: hypothetical protein AAF589_03820 [Planctomycetota bacterium]